MTFDEKRFLEQVNSVDAGRYEMYLAEVLAICKEYCSSHSGLVHAGFKYGFLKGQRAAKAEMKRKRNKGGTAA